MTMSGTRNRVVKIGIAQVVIDLQERGTAKGSRTPLLDIVLGKFDNAQHAIRQPRHLVAQKSGELIETTGTPHPAMTLDGKPNPQASGATHQKHDPHPSRRIEKTIEGKHQQVRQHESTRCGQQSLRDLDQPYPPAKCG